MDTKIVKKQQSKQYKDVYRQSHLRYLGYSSEIIDGIYLTKLVPSIFLRMSYGLSAAYIFADAIDKALKQKHTKGSEPIDVAIKAKNAILWQMFASILFPGFIIHGIKDQTSSFARMRFRAGFYNSRILGTFAGLASIPLIIKPIDKLVDIMMFNPKDSSVRKNPNKSKMKDDHKQGDKEYDIYRDSALRYTGYSNEIGEAFRALWPKHLVNLTYVAAVVYVLADTTNKGAKVYEKPGAKATDVAIQAGDVLTWQMFASVIVPGFTINRVTKGARYIVQHFKVPKSKYIPTIIGLASIPLIVKPIDRLVDYLMDKSYRKYFT